MGHKSSAFDDDCSEHSILKKSESECAGVVKGLAPTAAFGFLPVTDLLLSPVLKTDCVHVSPTGGLFVEEDGNYLVKYSARGVLAPGGPPVILTIFADAKFLGSVIMGNPTSVNFVNFAKIVHLRKGDEVYVLVNQGVVILQGTLTVAKLKGERVYDKPNLLKKENCELECQFKEKHDDKKGCAGVVAFKTVGPFAFGMLSNPIILPLTNGVLLTDCVRVSPKGGIIVEEEGDYLVHFAGRVLGINSSLSIYVDSKLLGNVQLSGGSDLELANFAKVVRLKKGDTVFASFLSGGIFLFQDLTLTVAKLK
ncbi:hypothetical protein JOD45_000381 [Scopulibacillus daqui]|uniref:Biogenesis AIM24 protein n=1 Tax=Scopulibacillus daqui TaxID=1469162 RepID=A0ABS2PX94_9BACL|nr:hypothetical protein [Scopulibacillus daqui]MBM7644190.1 hypothetical protein [Scopulibacillus daqui]